MRQDENGNYIPTSQQRKMIESAGKHWSLEHQPDLYELIRIWAEEVSFKIPMYSIMVVFDYLVETGFYNPHCV